MVTRRSFIRQAGLAAAGVGLSQVVGLDAFGAASYNRIMGANGKVNLACIGIGNRGGSIAMDLDKTGLANIVAICDVDMGAKHTLEVMNKYPNAKRFKDFREMFDKMGNEIEAVSIGTPDHSHFAISMMAIKLGKHIYVEKPMARTFHEAELMMQAARKYPKVVTQVGNQGHSEANYFQFKAWKDAGIIKDVTKMVAHMNSPRRWHGWDPKISKMPAAQPIPQGLDWDTWLTSAPYHEYNEKYHYGDWRCWYDFGMGALGDWGAHIIDTAHEFLDLGLPYEVNPIKLEGHNDYFFPMSSTLQFRFPKRRKMPAMDIMWYDGVNNQPPLPEGYGVSELDPNIPTVAGGKLQSSNLNPGKIIYSDDLIFKGGTHGSTLSIIPEQKAKDMASKLPTVPASTSNHFANFLLACMGKEKTRSPFEVFGPMSQVFSLGVMAQRLNSPLKFDRETKTITNNKFADAMLTGLPPRKGWEEFYKI
ncbi:oxidoreductase family protein [Arcticibacter pallidicorallinus]|uniref:Oxidoreductase family protein n=1 Tax=Arcticibacter pallidicorallinus TaxID=1259464 RepID=A0A2T0TRS1_9SPHI|nr:Gfo/Idh/MocA family oxidoreductase [Arcticibacter pallidicorallinus]PRY48349.1 oxidoreductase family protein [Arcticibacter pallidicorallinus]